MPNQYTIGPKNPAVGRSVKVTWIAPKWGYPAGFVLTGTLEETFAVGGRVVIGHVRTPQGRLVRVPWSKRCVEVEVSAQ